MLCARVGFFLRKPSFKRGGDLRAGSTFGVMFLQLGLWRNAEVNAAPLNAFSLALHVEAFWPCTQQEVINIYIYIYSKSFGRLIVFLAASHKISKSDVFMVESRLVTPKEQHRKHLIPIGPNTRVSCTGFRHALLNQLALEIVFATAPKPWGRHRRHSQTLTFQCTMIIQWGQDCWLCVAGLLAVGEYLLCNSPVHTRCQCWLTSIAANRLSQWIQPTNGCLVSAEIVWFLLEGWEAQFIRDAVIDCFLLLHVWLLDQ